jgi:mucin-associated surface protein (MASP), putative
MSNKKGVQVIAPFVAPEGTPVAYVSDIAGAHRVVATKADLTAIPAALLEVGMTAFVKDEGKEYRLETKSETPVTSDWTSAAPSAADIKVAEDKTLADVLITKDEVATKISDAVTAAGETYQTKEDALAAKTALEESIHAVSTAGLSEETKQDIQAAKNAAATITGFQQTLDQTKTELAQKVEEAKQAALTQEDKTAIASIADVKVTAEAAKAKAEELEPKITTNKEAVDGLKTKVEALPDSDAVDAKISTAKEAINGSIDLVKESVAALKTVVQGSEDGATKGLDAKLTEAKQEAADNLAAAKQALEHSIEQAATAGLPEETKQDIQAAKEAATKLTEMTSKVDDAVAKANDADTKVGTLGTKVTALETFKTDAEPKLAEVDTVKEAVDTLKDTTVPAIDTRVTALEGKAAPTDFTEGQKTKLDEILAGKHYASADDIDNAKAALKNELATQDSVNQLANQTLTTAEGKVTEAKEELEGKITELNTKVEGIHVPDVDTLASKVSLDKLVVGLLIKDLKTYTNASGDKVIAVKFNEEVIPHKTMPVNKLFYELHDTYHENAITSDMLSSTPNTKGYYTITLPAVKIASGDINIQLLNLIYHTDEFGDLSTTLTLYDKDFPREPAAKNDKYIVVVEQNQYRSGDTKKLIAPIKMVDGVNDYNFIVKLPTGGPTNINVLFGTVDPLTDQEFIDLPACMTINGQYGQFASTDIFSSDLAPYIADELYDPADNRDYLRYPNGNKVKFNGYKLKTELTPDGQNDTYIVTYHRPVNHG